MCMFLTFHTSVCCALSTCALIALPSSPILLPSSLTLFVPQVDLLPSCHVYVYNFYIAV